MIKLLEIAVVLIATLVVAITLLQGRILFSAHAVPSAGPLPSSAEPLAVETPDGHRLHGVYLPPIVANEPETPRTPILGSGGNGWNAQDVAATLIRLFPHAHVAAFHYRGYRPSTGAPSARGRAAGP